MSLSADVLEPCFGIVEGSTEGRAFACGVRRLDFLSLSFLDGDLPGFPLRGAAEPGESS